MRELMREWQLCVKDSHFFIINSKKSSVYEEKEVNYSLSLTKSIKKIGLFAHWLHILLDFVDEIALISTFFKE